MSKMGELDVCVDELRSAAQALNSVADSLITLFSDKPILSKAVPPPPQLKPLTLEQVRAVLAEKSRDGHTTKIRELLIKHGAEKLSEIAPDKYSALLAEVEVLGNE